MRRSHSANSIRDRGANLTQSPDVWLQSLPSWRHEMIAWQMGGDHVWLDAGSVALHFVYARDNVADFDKTPGPPATRGSSHFASLSLCSSMESAVSLGQDAVETE